MIWLCLLDCSRALKAVHFFRVTTVFYWIHWIWLLYLIQDFQCRITYWALVEMFLLPHPQTWMLKVSSGFLEVILSVQLTKTHTYFTYIVSVAPLKYSVTWSPSSADFLQASSIYSHKTYTNPWYTWESLLAKPLLRAHKCIWIKQFDKELLAKRPLFSQVLHSCGAHAFCWCLKTSSTDLRLWFGRLLAPLMSWTLLQNALCLNPKP
jgi:hypothetical protein